METQYHRVIGLLIAVLFLWLSPVQSGTITSQHFLLPYRAIIAVDDAAIAVPIDFNGDGRADIMSDIVIYNAGQNDVFFSLGMHTTSDGAPLPAGFTWSSEIRTALNVQHITVKCASGLTSTLYIWAMP